LNSALRWWGDEDGKDEDGKTIEQVMDQEWDSGGIDEFTELRIQKALEDALGPRRRRLPEIWLPDIKVGFSPSRGEPKLRAKTESSRVMLSAVNLSRLHRLRRVRQCKQCWKWFFVRFKHEKFCRPKCYEKYWGNGRRNKYQRVKQRQYARIERLRNETNLRAAQKLTCEVNDE
jgi:hypothetical protein